MDTRTKVTAHFANSNSPTTVHSLSLVLEIPERTLRTILSEMVQAGVLTKQREQHARRFGDKRAATSYTYQRK